MDESLRLRLDRAIEKNRLLWQVLEALGKLFIAQDALEQAKREYEQADERLSEIQ